MATLKGIFGGSLRLSLGIRKNVGFYNSETKCIKKCNMAMMHRRNQME